MDFFMRDGKRNRDKIKIEIENTQREQFQNILNTAQDIINKTTTYEGTHPIYLLVKQLVNKELYDNIFQSVSTIDSENVKAFTKFDLLPNDMFDENTNSRKGYLYKIEDDYISYDEFIEQCRIENKSITIKLGYDPVLTRPWNENRLTDALCNIGKGKPHGDWKQDYHNHHSELWLPFGITFVSSGNHSITAGILNNEGEIEVTSIYNMSNVFSYIYCDGVNYFRKEDNSLLAPVSNFLLATIFEIGRLINKQLFTQKPIKFKSLDVY